MIPITNAEVDLSQIWISLMEGMSGLSVEWAKFEKSSSSTALSSVEESKHSGSSSVIPFGVK